MSTQQEQSNCSHPHHFQNIPPGVTLLPISRACKILSIGKTKFYQLRQEDENFPKLVVIGRSRLVRSDELQQWILSLPRAIDKREVAA